jgi:hypothetical protein
MYIIDAILVERIPVAGVYFTKENAKFVQTMTNQLNSVQLSLREKAEKVLYSTSSLLIYMQDTTANRR